MKISLSMCLYRRPDYTYKILEALNRCKELSGLPLYVSIDNFTQEMSNELSNIVRKYRPDAHIHQFSTKCGCNSNTFKALSMGFESGSEFNIHIEDDVLLAPDAGKYFLWAAEKYKDDKQIFTIGDWSLANGDPSIKYKTGKQSFFTCWGFGTWEDRWPEIRDNWTKGTDMSLSWDVKFDEVRNGRLEVLPHLSRAQNIGSENGTHRGDCILPQWAGEMSDSIEEFYK